jgi:hypothetical protein
MLKIGINKLFAVLSYLHLFFFFDQLPLLLFLTLYIALILSGIKEKKPKGLKKMCQFNRSLYEKNKNDIHDLVSTCILNI